MIVAIIRGFGPEVCLRLAEAYMKGGIGHVEVTFNQKDPGSWKDTAAAIRSIKSGFGNELKVGAGTVLTEEQLRICEDAGGEFMVTPNVNAELIRKCVADGLEATPGALTPSEAVEAFNAGASVVKIFPAGALGPGYIKAIKAPLSHIPLLAVGGIGPDNIADFMKAGCVGAGVGGNLTNKEWIKAGEWDKITAVARALVENSKI
jgi:2-dehydro-3-deoxyphosphogluconate aldolase/(4S)-4-hydroxy-2-oxoglutarate aldolase